MGATGGVLPRLDRFQPFFVDQDRWEVSDPDVVSRGHGVAIGRRPAVDQTGDLHGGGLPHDQGARRMGTQFLVLAGSPDPDQFHGMKLRSLQIPIASQSSGQP